MRLHALLPAIALVAASCAVVAPLPPRQDVDRHLEELHARGLFQGAVVLGRGGRVTYARGFGFANVEAGAPFTVDTPTDGASLTKTFTAAAIVELASESKVDLEALVQRYLPGYPHAATRVRHLLAHSAGLPDYDWFDRHVPPPAVRSNADQLALLRTHVMAPAFAPGARFAYDNVAYDSAALVVEAASGVPYETYVRRELLDPLGMRSTFLRPARLGEFAGVRTVGYRRGGAGAERFDAFEGEAFHGGGNLYFTAMDLHRWASAFAAGATPLDRAALARGLERARLDDGTRTNLAMLSWYPAPGGARHYYTGHHQGFYNFVYWDSASGVTVVMVSNSGLATTLATELPRNLIALAEGRQPVRHEIRAAAAVTRDAIAGRWNVEGVGPVSIRVEKAAQYLELATGLEVRMFRFGPGLYAAPGLDGWIRFHQVPGGLELTWDSVYLVVRGTRAEGS